MDDKVQMYCLKQRKYKRLLDENLVKYKEPIWK